MMNLQTTSTVEIIWISIRDPLNIHRGDRGYMEVWRLYGPPMDVMFRVGRDIVVCRNLSYIHNRCPIDIHDGFVDDIYHGGNMDFHWKSIQYPPWT